MAEIAQPWKQQNIVTAEKCNRRTAELLNRRTAAPLRKQQSVVKAIN